MLIKTIIYGVAIGILVSLLWGAALGAEVITSIRLGGLIGLILGTLIALYGKAATARGNVQEAEAMFVNSSVLTSIGLLAIGSGALAWVVRWIFF